MDILRVDLRNVQHHCPDEAERASIYKAEVQDRINFILSLGFSEKFIDILRSQSPTLRCKDIFIRTIETLKKHGFKDPIYAITYNPSLLGMRLEKNIEEKKVSLEQMGFENPMKLIQKIPVILGYDTQKNIQGKIDALKELGIPDPVKVLTRYHNIFRVHVDTLKKRVDTLKDMGFMHPNKIINQNPSILCLRSENIAIKMQYLQSLGFRDPIKMMERNTQIVGLAQDNIHHKIESLYGMGFKNPIHVVEVFPQILNLNVNTIQGKIEAMHQMGFPNPVNTIEHFPPMLGYSIQGNVKNKIHILNTIVGDEKIRQYLLNTYPAILGGKEDKIWTILRGLKILNLLDTSIARSYPHIQRQRIEVFIYAVETIKNDPTLSTLPTELKIQKIFSLCNEYQRKTSQEQQKEFVYQLPETNPLRRRYLRGYPIK